MVDRVRRARYAVGATFAVNGMTFANLVPRYPEIVADLGLDNAAFGAAVAAWPLGALLSGLFAGVAVTRWSSKRVIVGASLAMSALLAGVGWASSWLALAAVFLCVGLVDALIDIANNAQGLWVQRRIGTSIITGLHGLWSVGAVVGGLIGSAFAGLGVPVRWQPAGHRGAVRRWRSWWPVGSCSRATSRSLTRSQPDATRRPSRQPTGRAPRVSAGVVVRLLLICLVGLAGAAGEDAGNTWGALYLTGSLGTTAAVGGAVFVAMQTTMIIGRFAGDPLVTRFGPRGVSRVGGDLDRARVRGGAGRAQRARGGGRLRHRRTGDRRPDPAGHARRRRAARAPSGLRPGRLGLDDAGRLLADPTADRDRRRPGRTALGLRRTGRSRAAGDRLRRAVGAGRAAARPVADLWYAAYGSNLARDRFEAYLFGGRPAGATRHYPGARDPSPPLDDRPLLLPGRLFFAGDSPTWGGGIAFYDADGEGTVYARAYRITTEQFSDLAAQEMRRDPGVELDLSRGARAAAALVRARSLRDAAPGRRARRPAGRDLHRAGGSRAPAERPGTELPRHHQPRAPGVPRSERRRDRRLSRRGRRVSALPTARSARLPQTQLLLLRRGLGLLHHRPVRDVRPDPDRSPVAPRHQVVIDQHALVGPDVEQASPVVVPAVLVRGHPDRRPRRGERAQPVRGLLRVALLLRRHLGRVHPDQPDLDLGASW